MTPVTDPTLISQLEGGNSQAPIGAPVTDPALIAQLEGSQNPSLLPRIGADALAGLAQMGRGIINTPHNFINSIPAYQPNFDYGKALGVNNPNIGDKLVQGAAQYAPYTALGPIPGGALFGATQDSNPVQGAAVGAATGGVLGLAGKGLGALGSGIKSYLSQYAAPGLTSSISDALQSAKNTTNAQAFDATKQNFQNYSAKEGQAWDSLTQQAKNIDDANIPPEYKPQFNDTSYKSAIKNKLTNLQNQSDEQSGLALQNQPAQDMLANLLNDQTGSFSDAFNHNKALNVYYQNEITPGKSVPFQVVNQAKGALSKTIQQNIEDNGLQDTLGQAWKDANAATQQKNQIFNQIVSPKGKEQFSTFSQIVNGKNPNVDPTTFVNDYLPTSRGDGTQKMQQFAQMLGDDNQAKNVLKMNYFDKAFTSDGIDPKAFVNRYNNLSSDQQNYLFNPQENQQIQSLSKIAEQHPGSLSKSSFTGFLTHSAPAVAGYMGAPLLGMGHIEGGIAGLLAGNAANHLMGKAFENPIIQNYMKNYLTGSPVQQSSSAISKSIMALLAPQVVNKFGGQQQ